MPLAVLHDELGVFWAYGTCVCCDYIFSSFYFQPCSRSEYFVRYTQLSRIVLHAYLPSSGSITDSPNLHASLPPVIDLHFFLGRSRFPSGFGDGTLAVFARGVYGESYDGQGPYMPRWREKRGQRMRKRRAGRWFAVKCLKLWNSRYKTWERARDIFEPGASTSRLPALSCLPPSLSSYLGQHVQTYTRTMQGTASCPPRQLLLGCHAFSKISLTC